MKDTWFVADFETTSYNTYIKTNDTKVWLSALCDSSGAIVGNPTSIVDFMHLIKKNCNHSTIYFHNLKFDGSFILNYLLKHNYTYESKLNKNSSKTYSCLIDDLGAYFTIEIAFDKRTRVKIVDSLKLIPLKVSEIAKAFNLEISKGSIDYSTYIVNKETIDYVNNDVLIVHHAIKYFKEQGFNKITIGSNAYNLCSSEIKYYDKLFPIIDNELLDIWRLGYRGGRTQVNPIYQNKILTNVKRYDINSMYPFCQGYLPLPYGHPIECKECGNYEFEIYQLDISFKLKQGHLPTLLKSSSRYMAESYYINTDSIETIVITNNDYYLLQKHYNISFCKFKRIWGFKTSTTIFKDFINKYYNLKNINTGGLKLMYKLIINNLYGKYGSRHKGKHKIPTLKGDILGFTTSEEQEMKHYYLPVAMAIVSHAHVLIDNAIETTGVNNFVYCDTDSVHTLGDLPTELVDQKEIGKFKLEGVEGISKYVRTKCYIYKENNKINVTCCGLPNNTKQFLINKHGDNLFNIFTYGLKVDSNYEGIKTSDLKLTPKQVKGGVVLKPTPFEIKER